MLQINLIREKPEFVKQRLAIRNFQQPQLVDEILSEDEKRKSLQTQFDNTQAKVNSTSKEIGQLMAAGKKDEAESKKKEVASLKQALQPISEELDVTGKRVTDLMLQLPNLPSELVPPGKTPEDNVVVRAGGSKPELYAGAKPHWDLAKQYNLINFELGNKITGSGFPVRKSVRPPASEGSPISYIVTLGAVGAVSPQ